MLNLPTGNAGADVLTGETPARGRSLPISFRGVKANLNGNFRAGFQNFGKIISASSLAQGRIALPFSG